MERVTGHSKNAGSLAYESMMRMFSRLAAVQA